MHYLTEALTGLFLFAEANEAFLSSAVFQFGSNPVEATGHLHAIRGVGITVEALKDKHPLIRAEVNGLSGFLAWHEWSLAVSVNALYCKTGVKG